MNSILWFIAILPPDDVAEKIRAIQQDIADRFGPRRALKIPVHITLESPFRFAEEDNVDLGIVLRDFFTGRQSFDLELRNFGTFRHDVIFVEVSPSLPLLELQQALHSYLRIEKQVVEKSPWQGGYTPHVTVANRDVSAQQHQLIWKEYNTRKFHARFRVSEISLLAHDGKVWQVRQRFALMP